jgi:hypothetical protein
MMGLICFELTEVIVGSEFVVAVDCLPGCDAVCSGRGPLMFRRDVMPLSLGLEN